MILFLIVQYLLALMATYYSIQETVICKYEDWNLPMLNYIICIFFYIPYIGTFFSMAGILDFNKNIRHTLMKENLKRINIR